ncbi:response regulator [Candidatus Sumerlaeota bacterium]|nr:response regulator [Candidatus Sumerlaeota bacterium]
MLSVILGYGQYLVDELHAGDPLRECALEIVSAGNRSAALTRQLLAFSRRQTLQLEVLDVNDVLKNLEKMLRRLIGEDIEFVTRLAEDLRPAEVDPGQIEQVIMNLAVNARDAMPQGGTLTIETANADLDEYYAQDHPGIAPGEFVMLSITDTGCGMDEETMRRVFEPFFTTKQTGKGTGLGLSTVYGIVKQMGGSIWVYSEPGSGATFKVYLPRAHAEPLSKHVQTKKEGISGRGENILVVEDDPSLRKLCGRIMASLKYNATVVANGGEALLLVEEQGMRPDLLLTDVVMPGIGGRVLVDRLRRTLPNLKVLYMSGYTDDSIAQHGVLDPGTPFIHKPFTSRDLSIKISSLLRGEE